MNEKKTAQIGIRVKPTLRDALSLCATKEDRSVAWMAERFIKEGLLRYSEQHPEFNLQWDRLFGDQYKDE